MIKCNERILWRMKRFSPDSPEQLSEPPATFSYMDVIGHLHNAVFGAHRNQLAWLSVSGIRNVVWREMAAVGTARRRLSETDCHSDFRLHPLTMRAGEHDALHTGQVPRLDNHNDVRRFVMVGLNNSHFVFLQSSCSTLRRKSQSRSSDARSLRKRNPNRNTT